ncbi:hypothetical protein LCGC14_1265970, partial [marine sediment metagenome]
MSNNTHPTKITWFSEVNGKVY